MSWSTYRELHSTPLHSRHNKRIILIDFSLTVKAATLIFISGRGSAISSAEQGKSGCINKLFGPRKRACIFHEILTV